jgi:hypothetical protein
VADQQTLVGRLTEALDDGLIEFVKAQQTTLANRLGADRNITTATEERGDAENALRNAKAAHEFMRTLVTKVFS